MKLHYLLPLLLLAPCAWGADKQPERPNIILINADDLGVNDLGCYGRKDHHTPHLDKLATEGLRFTSAYCGQPICSPSRLALMSGKTPARLHLTTYLPGRPDTRAQKVLHPKIRMELPLEEETLAESLKKAGYTTGCIGKWHLGGKGFGPGEQGFDVVAAGQANTKPSATEGGKGEYALTDQAVKFITDNRDKPFFLYLPHNNPHIPLAAKPELVEKNKSAFNPIYAAVIETLDDVVGKLLARVDELKLRDRTIVIFTSDNGGVHIPELREDCPTHNTPFRAGKGFLYEGGLRIPLIVRWPGHIKPGVTATPVVNTDIMPTLLELVGASTTSKLDGVSYAPLLTGKGELPARPFFWHFPHYNNQGGRPSGAVREGEWKLIEFYDADQRELYHLGQDPSETKNLAALEPKRAAELREKLAQWRQSIDAQENKPNPDYDPALYQKLYVDADVSRLKPAATAAETAKKVAEWRKGMDSVVPRKGGQTSRPNVIFIMADDLGCHEVGCYGQKKIRTPSMDRLAEQGMRFTQAYSGSPVCAPSRCCLMTGKHGGHAYIRNNSEVKPEGQQPIPDAEVTIAELFKKQGYVTGAMGKWGLGPPGTEGDPIKQGFDLFFGYNCQRHAHSHYPTYLWRNDQRIALPANDGKAGKTFSHDLFEAEALKFIRDNKDRPFFLYLPFIIPHVAVQVPDDSLAEYKGKFDDPPYDGKKGYLPHPSPRAGYAAMVTRMDRSIGRILDLLKEQGLDDNTVVFFTSDNGPTHNVGGADSTFFESAGPLRGLKGSVYEGGIRTPLLVRWPGKIKAGSVSELPCYFPDMMPTLMDLIGAAGSAPKNIDGVSIAPTLLGQAEKQQKRDHMVWEFSGYGGQQAVRLGDWKGVRQNMNKGSTKIELYHLKDDVGEKNDVADKHPALVKRIEQIMTTDRVPSKLFPMKVLDAGGK